MYSIQPYNSSQLSLPETVLKTPLLYDEARRLGLHIVGGSGSGKSRFAGRALIPFDLLRGRPQIAIDPSGALAKNVIDVILRLPYPERVEMFSRLRYIDLGATDSVCPLPAYLKLSPDESLFTTATRYLETIKRLDPHLQEASIEGYAALYEIGAYAGMIAIALGGQITEAVDVIKYPGKWIHRIHAVPYNRELKPAIDYFKAFKELHPSHQARRSGSFLNRMMPILADPAMKALLAASTPAVTMQEIEEQNLTVIVDASTERNQERKQTKLMHWLLYAIDYFNLRGTAGRRKPIGFVIDEITALLGFSSKQNDAMANEIEQLISVISRNYGVYTTILHQSLVQISEERIRGALMSMGNQMVGMLHSPDDRLYVAQQFFDYDPYKVKKEIPTYFNMSEPTLIPTGPFQVSVFAQPNPIIIDHTTEEFSIDEQLLELAKRFSPERLGKFNFLTRFARNEGDYSNALTLLPTHTIDPGLFPREELVHLAQQGLRVRDGTAVAELLAEIDQRQVDVLRHPARQQRKRVKKYDKIRNSPENNKGRVQNHGEHTISVPPNSPHEWGTVFWYSEDQGTPDNT